MGSVVVDASVVLASLDPDDALHQRARRALVDADADDSHLILPASCLAEMLVRAAAEGEAELQRIDSLVEAVFGPPFPMDAEVAKAAARRRARHRTLRLSDAIVLGTADVCDAELILTGDKRWRRLDQRVGII